MNEMGLCLTGKDSKIPISEERRKQMKMSAMMMNMMQMCMCRMCMFRRAQVQELSIYRSSDAD